MAERRDQPPEPETGPRLPAIPRGTRLSPVQEAWGAYVDHATHCDICRSPDAGHCETAETLHRAYEDIGNAAFRKLRHGAI